MLLKLHPKVSVESLITGSITLLAIVTFSIGYVQDFTIVFMAMVIGGAGYITILSTFITKYREINLHQNRIPRSSTLAIYLLVT